MHRLTLTADLGYRLSPDDVQALNVSAGAEYAWMEHLMLRGGYHYGDKNKGDASYATAGAGVEYAGVHLDFAWMFAGHECLARNTFWISLGYSFNSCTVSPRSLYTYIRLLGYRLLTGRL